MGRIQHGCIVLVESRCSRFSWCLNVGLQPSLPCLGSSGVSASHPGVDLRRSRQSRQSRHTPIPTSVLKCCKSLNGEKGCKDAIEVSVQLYFRLLLLKSNAQWLSCLQCSDEMLRGGGRLRSDTRRLFHSPRSRCPMLSSLAWYMPKSRGPC